MVKMKKIHIYIDGWTEAEEFVINEEDPKQIVELFKKFLDRMWDIIKG